MPSSSLRRRSGVAARSAEDLMHTLAFSSPSGPHRSSRWKRSRADEVTDPEHAGRTCGSGVGTDLKPGLRDGWDEVVARRAVSGAPEARRPSPRAATPRVEQRHRKPRGAVYSPSAARAVRRFSPGRGAAARGAVTLLPPSARGTRPSERGWTSVDGPGEPSGSGRKHGRRGGAEDPDYLLRPGAVARIRSSRGSTFPLIDSRPWMITSCGAIALRTCLRDLEKSRSRNACKGSSCPSLDRSVAEEEGGKE